MPMTMTTMPTVLGDISPINILQQVNATFDFLVKLFEDESIWLYLCRIMLNLLECDLY